MICEKCGSTNISVSNIEGFQVEVCEKCLNVKEYYTDKELHDKFKLEVQREKEEANKRPEITCPYCQSTNTSKIGVIGRSVSFGLLGFGSGKVGKQWHCNKCKSDF